MSDKKFHYVYTAPTAEERKEIDSIRRQYEVGGREKSKLEQLRDLHKRVKGRARAWSLGLGIIGCLVFGLGITMVLEWEVVFGGVLVGIGGALLMGVAYPVHQWLFKKSKEKYGAEILRISEELLASSK